MRLFLTGGGDSENFRELDDLFIEELGPEPRLLFIPLAGDESAQKDGLIRIFETFSTISFHHVAMCIDLQKLNQETLLGFDAVYLDGGNTFQLMHHIRKSHFYEMLRAFVHKGGVINGDSAGAIVLGSHLQTAHFGDDPDENETDLICYQGMNFLGDWAIHCHYKKSEDKEIKKFVKKFGLPVIALQEESGLFYNNGEVQVSGKAPVKFFTLDGSEKVKVGETFDLDL